MSTTAPPPTATHVMEASWGNGEAHVYRCEPPMPVHDWQAEDGHDIDDCSPESGCSTTKYVWVSAATVVFSGPETYIFPCDESGEVTDWNELPGSFRGGLDHEEALRDAGYVISHVSTEQ